MLKSKDLKYFNDHAAELSEFYNDIDRFEVHKELIKLMPKNKELRVLDIGACSGADAGLFASMGHDVLAVEPSFEMLSIAKENFKNNKIEWSSDSLPKLEKVSVVKRKFDIIYSVGTLQYLDKEARLGSLNKMISLLDNRGLLEIQYPVPPSREHQFLIPDNEIKNFVSSIKNLEISIIKKTKDFMGRKALGGSDLYIDLIIIRNLDS